jgi:hypothetical protein
LNVFYIQGVNPAEITLEKAIQLMKYPLMLVQLSVLILFGSEINSNISDVHQFACRENIQMMGMQLFLALVRSPILSDTAVQQFLFLRYSIVTSFPSISYLPSPF